MVERGLYFTNSKLIRTFDFCKSIASFLMRVLHACSRSLAGQKNQADLCLSVTCNSTNRTMYKVSDKHECCHGQCHGAAETTIDAIDRVDGFNLVAQISLSNSWR